LLVRDPDPGIFQLVKTCEAALNGGVVLSGCLHFSRDRRFHTLIRGWIACDLVCLLVRSQSRIDMPLGRHKRRGKRAVERPWRKRRDACCLDRSIETLMKRAELLVVRSVTGLVNI